MYSTNSCSFCFVHSTNWFVNYTNGIVNVIDGTNNSLYNTQIYMLFGRGADSEYGRADKEKCIQQRRDKRNKVGRKETCSKQGGG